MVHPHVCWSSNRSQTQRPASLLLPASLVSACPSDQAQCIARHQPDTRCLVLNTIHTPPSIPFPAIGPFAGLSNGFFSCWVAPFAALMLCRALSPLVSEPLGRLVAALRGAGSDRSVLVLLSASSTAVWVSAAVALGRYPDTNCDSLTGNQCHNGIKVWAICVGVLSMAACGGYLRMEEAAASYGYTFALALGGASSACVTHTRSRYPHNDTDLRTLASMMPLARPCTYMGIAPS